MISSGRQNLRRQDLWVPAGTLLLATVLRAGWPRLTEFKFSEARLQALALELTRGGSLPLVGVPSSAGFDHSPLSVYLYAPAFLLSSSPIPATIYGGLAGVAAVALCWWLSRRWPGGGRWAALVATLLFAVSPWAVAFSRKIWQVAFVPLLALAFVGLIVSSLIEGRRWNLTWALVVLSLLVQVHPSAVSLGLALLIWLIVFRQQVSLAPFVAGVGLGVVVALPFIAHQMKSGWPVLAALGSLPEAVWDLGAARLAWEAITGRGIHALAGDAYPFLKLVPQLGWTFNLSGWLAVGSTLWLVWRLFADWRSEDAGRSQAARVDLVLLSWLMIPILFNLRHSLDLYLHFFALVMPAAYLVIGRAGQDLVRRSDGRVQGVLRVGVLVVLGLLVVGQVAALGMMARFVATHDTPGGFERPLGRYLDVAGEAVAAAADSEAVEVLVVGQGDSPVVDETPAIFDVLLRGRVPYRLVDGGSAAVFPSHRALALVAPEAGDASEWYRPWLDSELPDGFWLATLNGSWPEADLEPVAGPRLFQNGVEVQGYAWQGEAANGQVRAWLLWQVLWQSPDDTHFFVQLLDDQMRPLGQQDSDGYPAAYRTKGDRIISMFDIKYDETQAKTPYWLRAGQYLFPEVVNVPVIDGAGAPVGEVVHLGPVSEGP